MGKPPDSQPRKFCRDMRMSETRYTGLGQVRAQGQRVCKPEGQQLSVYDSCTLTFQVIVPRIPDPLTVNQQRQG